MLTAQRKTLLLQRLAAQGRLVAADLARELEVSEDTIRRDLRELAAEGRLQRVHGGALPLAAAEGDLALRGRLCVEDKAALGRHAAGLMRDGQVILLDGGTTALQVAHHLPPALRATVVTHSPAVALAAAACPGVEVWMLGGRLFRHSMVNVGAGLVEAASRVRADLYFLGVTGVHPEAGLTTGDAEEAAVKRALHARAGRTIVLASSEKLLAASAFVVLPLDAVSCVVVPSSVPPPVLRGLRAAGASVQTLPT